MSENKSILALKKYLKNATPEQLKKHWDNTYIPGEAEMNFPTIEEFIASFSCEYLPVCDIQENIPIVCNRSNIGYIIKLEGNDYAIAS